MYIALNIDARRTSVHTRRPVFFIDTKGNGYGLGKGSVNGRSISQALIPFTGDCHRADIHAFTAPGTDTFHYIPRLATDLNGVVADVSRDFLNLAVGKQLDVCILGHFNHFWGSDTGGTVEGRKGLIELEHMAANG